MVSKAQLRQYLFFAALIGLILFLLGITIGVLVGLKRRKASQQIVSAGVQNEAGLGISRQGLIDVFAKEDNGAYQFEPTQGGTYDYYLGTSEKFSNVSLMLNGPPGDLQQVGIVFSLGNVGRRVELKDVLTAVMKVLGPNVNVTQVMNWLDKTTPKVQETKLIATTPAGTFRLLLRDVSTAEKQRSMLTIEPGIRVTWRRD